MTGEERLNNNKPRVDELPLSELSEFPGNPFKVQQGEELDRMIESIHQFGVLVPALARPKNDRYEIVSGHRRLAACRALGLAAMWSLRASPKSSTRLLPAEEQC